MANATPTQPVESEADSGISYLCVRLEEPFDRIVANNPGLTIEQNAHSEIVFMSPTGGESGHRNAKLIAFGASDCEGHRRYTEPWNCLRGRSPYGNHSVRSALVKPGANRLAP